MQHLEWPGNAPAEIAFVNPGGGALNIWVPAGDPRPALYTGRAPAMRGIYGPDPSRRGADEDLRLIDRFKRRFLCLRLPARGTPSTFATVIETKAGTVRSVNRLGDRVLLVASSNRTDLVFTHVHEPLQVAIGKRTATIAGAYGYLAVDAVGTVVDYYLVDGAIELDGKTFVRTRGPASLTLLDSDGGPTARFVPGELDAARLSRFCRFVLPGGEVYGNLLAAVDPASGRATLLENTGFVPDRPNWRWLSYPLGPIVGGITVELFPRATGNPCPWPEPEAVPPGRASR